MPNSEMITNKTNKKRQGILQNKNDKIVKLSLEEKSPNIS